METLSKSSELDLDSQAAFALLRYRMLTNRYSQFAFEESPAYVSDSSNLLQPASLPAITKRLRLSLSWSCVLIENQSTTPN